MKEKDILKRIKDLGIGSSSAEGTNFDNSTNGMTSTNVQKAIEENKNSITSLENLVGHASEILIEECNKLLEI